MQRLDGWGPCIGSSVPTCFFSRRCAGGQGRFFSIAAYVDIDGGSFFEGCWEFFTPNISFMRFFHTAATTCCVACIFSEA
jgi:hypothetical protein